MMSRTLFIWWQLGSYLDLRDLDGNEAEAGGVVRGAAGAAADGTFEDAGAAFGFLVARFAIEARRRGLNDDLGGGKRRVDHGFASVQAHGGFVHVGVGAERDGHASCGFAGRHLLERLRDHRLYEVVLMHG